MSIAYLWYHISRRIFKYLPGPWTPAKNQPKTGPTRQGNGQNSCCLHFCFTFVQIDFEIFDEYFLKWMWILSFLTSITYSLTPRTSNLVNVEANGLQTAVYCVLNFLFEVVVSVLGCDWIFRSQFISVDLIGQEIDKQPIKNTVSYGVLFPCSKDSQSESE